MANKSMSLPPAFRGRRDLFRSSRSRQILWKKWGLELDRSGTVEGTGGGILGGGGLRESEEEKK